MSEIVNFDAEVLSIKKIATRVFMVSLGVAKEISEMAKPGNYCSFKSWDISDPHKRPFSIVAAGNGYLVFIIDAVGPNTEYYTSRKKGDVINITKPLGTEINFDDRVENYIFVLGGVGTAAGLLPAKILKANNKSVMVLIGARSKDRLIAVEEYQSLGCGVQIVAQKDATGPFVTELFEKELLFARPGTVVVTCGPMPMMLKVAEMCGENYPCLMILETVFACNMGACYGCTVFLAKREDGKDGDAVRVCVKGPAFWSHDLDLEKLKQAHLPVDFRSPIESCDLSVNLAGVEMRSPVMVASAGLSAHSLKEEAMDLGKVGGLETKGLSLKPIEGNPIGRVCKTPSGMLNAIGLQNPGLEVFLQNELGIWHSWGIPVFVNIFGELIQEYADMAKGLVGSGIAGVVVNISCPNVRAGGLQFGVVPEMARDVTNAVVRAAEGMIVIVKLSPNVTDITEIARAVEGAGADAISLINTVTGMVVDTETHKPVLANIVGGLSGPAIKPVAVRMVWQVVNAVKIPVIGIGGINGPGPALEHLIAGAKAVQICTGGYSNPNIHTETVDGIEAHMLAKGFPTMDDLSGSLVLPKK